MKSGSVKDNCNAYLMGQTGNLKSETNSDSVNWPSKLKHIQIGSAQLKNLIFFLFKTFEFALWSFNDKPEVLDLFLFNVNIIIIIILFFVHFAFWFVAISNLFSVETSGWFELLI